MMNPLRYQEVARGDAPFLRVAPTAAAPTAADSAAPNVQTHSFGDVARAARRWSHAYRAAAVTPGDRVAIIGHNSADWIAAALGCFWIGATIVPLNVQLPSDRLESLIAELEVRAVVALGHFSDHDYGPIPHVVEADHEDEHPAHFDPEAVATIFFTSGTTGRPKPVPHTWAQHIASASASAFNLGISAHDDWLCVLPLYHIGGLAIVLRSLLYGTCLTLHSRFSTEAALDSLQGGVTLASFVPTMLKRVLEHPDSDSLHGGDLRGILLGGGPATRALLDLAADFELPLFQTYGMTEAASQLTTMPPAAALGRIGSAGLPILGVEIEIRDDAGSELGPGKVGNIWARGAVLTHGYLDRPAANAEVFDQRRWFFTGDFGRLDDDGFLWVESRRDDLIVSGGENVYPAEVESILSTHHAIEDLAVIGVADDEWGQRVVAFVVSSAQTATLDTIARELLAPFQVPRQWHHVDTLPRNPSGKVLRRELRTRVSAQP